MRQLKSRFYAHKKPKAPPPPPAPPPPASEYFYEGDQLTGARIYNPVANTFETRNYLDPDQQALQGKAQAGLSQSIDDISQLINDPSAFQGRLDEFAAPQLRALQGTYDDAMANATAEAVASGMGNSVGFDDYRANELDRKLALDRADIMSGAQQQLLGQLSGLAGMQGDVLSGERSFSSAMMPMLLQGGATGGNQLSQNYNLRLQQAQLANQMRPQGRSFFSKLFNPFGF